MPFSHLLCKIIYSLQPDSALLITIPKPHYLLAENDFCEHIRRRIDFFFNKIYNNIIKLISHQILFDFCKAKTLPMCAEDAAAALADFCEAKTLTMCAEDAAAALADFCEAKTLPMCAEDAAAALADFCEAKTLPNRLTGGDLSRR